jgi:hypothetical protein
MSPFIGPEVALPWSEEPINRHYLDPVQYACTGGIYSIWHAGRLRYEMQVHFIKKPLLIEQIRLSCQRLLS